MKWLHCFENQKLPARSNILLVRHETVSQIDEMEEKRREEKRREEMHAVYVGTYIALRLTTTSYTT